VPPDSRGRLRAPANRMTAGFNELCKIACRDPDDVQDADVCQSAIRAKAVDGGGRDAEVLGNLLDREQARPLLVSQTWSWRRSQTQARHKIAANRCIWRRRMEIAFGPVLKISHCLQRRATPSNAAARASQAECRRFETDIPLHRKGRKPQLEFGRGSDPPEPPPPTPAAK
jgi:hypothetical protein